MTNFVLMSGAEGGRSEIAPLLDHARPCTDLSTALRAFPLLYNLAHPALALLIPPLHQYFKMHLFLCFVDSSHLSFATSRHQFFLGMEVETVNFLTDLSEAAQPMPVSTDVGIPKASNSHVNPVSPDSGIHGVASNDAPPVDMGGGTPRANGEPLAVNTDDGSAQTSNGGATPAEADNGSLKGANSDAISVGKGDGVHNGTVIPMDTNDGHSITNDNAGVVQPLAHFLFAVPFQFVLQLIPSPCSPGSALHPRESDPVNTSSGSRQGANRVPLNTSFCLLSPFFMLWQRSLGRFLSDPSANLMLLATKG